MRSTSQAPARRGILAALALAGFVTSFGAHIVATNLPAYAAAVGAGALVIGLLIGVYDFAELFAKPLAGLLADRRGMKPTLLAGLAVFVLGSLLFLAVPPELLLLVRFVQGLGAAALSTVSIALVAHYFAERRGAAFGIYNAVKGAGYVLAPALGGWLVHAYGFASLFAVSAAVGTLALLTCLALPAERAEADLDDDDDLGPRALLAAFADRRLRAIYAVIVVNMFLVGILFGFLPVYLYGIGYTPAESGALLSVATLSYLLVQPLAGALADRVDARATVLGGLLLATLAIGGLTFTSGAVLVALAVLAGLGVGTVWTNGDALVGALADPQRLGASVGAAQSFKELGDMLGPLLVGLLTQLLGVRAGFVICAALALVFWLALAFGSRKTVESRV